MNSHRKQMVATIVISTLVVLYYVVYFCVLQRCLEGAWKLLLGGVPLAMSGVMVYVCIQRLREIKGGETDDLSKY
jgi:hypothetical protein